MESEIRKLRTSSITQTLTKTESYIKKQRKRPKGSKQTYELKNLNTTHFAQNYNCKQVTPLLLILATIH